MKLNFDDLLKDKLTGSFYERAKSLRNKYGIYSYDVINTLLHAFDKDKVDFVLLELEKHYREHLCFLSPVKKNTDQKTKDVFLGLMKSLDVKKNNEV